MKLFIQAATILLLSAIEVNALQYSRFGTDSIACSTNISRMKNYFDQGNYAGALEPFRWVFNNCPSSTKMVYLKGAAMFEKFIVSEKNAATRSKYIDTLMLIYDQRIKYFNEAGTVTGIKGLALYEWSPEKKQEIKYLLKKSVESVDTKPAALVLEKYFLVNYELYNEGIITKEEAINVFYQVSELIEANLTGHDSTDFNKSKINIESVFDSFATCENLVSIYSPQVATAPDNIPLLIKIVSLFSTKECYDAPIFLEAAEKLNKIEPGAKLKRSLAGIYAAKGLNAKAAGYFNDAVELESDNVKKATLLIESADFQLKKMKNYAQARTLSQRASSLRPDWGRPWMIIGDIYFTNASACKDEFNGAAVFWAATDKYLKAKSVDPSMREEADQKIAANYNYYPRKETVIKKGMRAGDPYTVKCWINETTIIRVKR